MTRTTKPPKARTATDLMADQIATGLFGRASPRKSRKRRQSVPLRYEYHEGTEEALEWAVGKDVHLPKSVRDWKEGALVVTDMVAQIMEQMRPRSLPALPALNYNDPPGPVLERFAAQLDTDGAWEPGWKLVEMGSGNDECIYCLVPEDLDVADAVRRYEVHFAREEAAREQGLASDTAKRGGEE